MERATGSRLGRSLGQPGSHPRGAWDLSARRARGWAWLPPGIGRNFGGLHTPPRRSPCTHRGPGPLPHARRSHGSVLLRAARARDAPFLAQHRERAGCRHRRAAHHRRPHPLGGPGCAAAQQVPHGATRGARVTPWSRLGGVHRSRYRGTSGARRPARGNPVGP